MTGKIFPAGNSQTKIKIEDEWKVLDLGSGHNPHPRADILVDRYLLDDTERSGAPVVLPSSKLFIVGDGSFMPFEDKSIDFIICSHVIEHIDSIDEFCAELNRVSKGGYLECPSKIAEILRHAPNHRWFVSNKSGKLVISPTPEGYPLGWFGKLFFSLYFYNTRQVKGRDVYQFAHGAPSIFHYIFLALREILVRLWTLLKPFTYTRFYWQNGFDWQVVNRK